MKFVRSLILLALAVLTPLITVAKLVAVATCVVAYNTLKASPFGAPRLALGANTLANLIPDTYAALKVVSRELVGLIPAVNRDSSADQLALNQTLRSAVAPVNTAGADITPAMAFPAASDQTITNVPFTIQKSRYFPFSWTGDEQYSMNQGPGILSINQQQIAQAIRAAIAEIGSHGYGILRAGASRAYGTAGTTPFATNLGESAQMRKILDDNGAPGSDRAIVCDTTAGANLRTLLNNPLNSNTSLNGELTAQGVLLDCNGFKFREDAQISLVTKGTGTSATTNAAGYAVGATTLTLAAAGTGTILAGDVITFVGDTNKYVVKTGNADVSAGGTIVLADPGLRVAMPTATKAITVGNNFTASLAFSRDFAILGTRLPKAPIERDLAVLREVVTDPVSGISFELTVWPGQRMLVYQVAICWGWAVENPEHGAIMLG